MFSNMMNKSTMQIILMMENIYISNKMIFIMQIIHSNNHTDFFAARQK